MKCGEVKRKWAWDLLQNTSAKGSGDGGNRKKKTSAKSKRANEANVAKILINVESTDEYMEVQCSVVFTFVYVWKFW